MEMHSSKEGKLEEKAQIYQVEFFVNNNNYIYIGSDTKCDPNYYGSSLIIYHYQKVYGDRLFKKTILEDLTNISHSDLCSIEQRYIKDSKKHAKSRNQHSINYTGQNRRDSGPKIDVAVLGNQIIKEAAKLGLELRMVSVGRGIIKPTYPPAPFDRASGRGMHIETNYTLKRIGFSFFRERGSDNNIGLATSILRQLEFDDDSISTLRPSVNSNYQLVLATHNSRNPKHLADLYKRLIELVETNSHLFSNDSNDNNEVLLDKDVIQSEDVVLNSEKHSVRRYKKGHIRIFRGSMSKPMPNTKAVLRQMDLEHHLNVGDIFWKNTRVVGKVILDKLEDKKYGVDADLFLRTTEAIEQTGKLHRRNAPVDSDVVSQAKIELSNGSFVLKKHRTQHIRIYKNEETIPVKNNKAVLRQISEEQGWEYNEAFFRKYNTRTIGNIVIKKINAERTK